MIETPPDNPSDQTPPWLKGLLSKSWPGFLLFLEVIGLRRGGGVDRAAQAAQVARLKLNHAEFRKLISANNSFLETMADLEHKVLNKELVDLPYIKRRALRAIADIHTMVETIILISNGRNSGLREVLAGISRALTQELQDSGPAADFGLVVDLSEIHRGHADLAGGKMANLGEIRNRLGLAVPEGFAVTTEGFRFLIEEGGLRSWIQDKDMELLSTQDVERVSQTMREQILNLIVPSSLKAALYQAYERLATRLGRRVHLAVRSSALGEDSDFSFAGQFLSLLNIGPEELVEAYLRVVASLYSPEAIHYRLLHGIPGQSAEMAVGFIAMVEASASGVTFSTDPNLPDSGQILIQTIRGLGIPLVEGQTSPERIAVPRGLDKGRIARVASQQNLRLVLSPDTGIKVEPVTPEEAGKSCLTDEEVLLLGQWALLLEDHFGNPQDIEWARDRDGKLILLQSRPLRLLDHQGQAGLPWPGYDLLLSGARWPVRGPAADRPSTWPRTTTSAPFRREEFWSPGDLPPGLSA